MADQELLTPVGGDVAERPMFDLAPFACTWEGAARHPRDPGGGRGSWTRGLGRRRHHRLAGPLPRTEPPRTYRPDCTDLQPREEGRTKQLWFLEEKTGNASPQVHRRLHHSVRLELRRRRFVHHPPQELLALQPRHDT